MSLLSGKRTGHDNTMLGRILKMRFSILPFLMQFFKPNTGVDTKDKISLSLSFILLLLF